jgi:outer membrane protein OmpA-like peptidoglycan-associated protein
MSTRILFFAGWLLSAACIHCGPKFQEPVGQTTERATPPPPANVPSTATAPDGGSADAAPSASVDRADACGTDPPVIAFDGASTNIDERQEQALRRVAECLNTPSLEKVSVVLIGYTDLVGTVGANLELGLTRAQTVMKRLVSGGVAPGRIVIASAGELQRPSARMGLHAPRVEILLTHGGPARPNEAPITRGIDAEGLLPRQPSSPSSPAQAAPTAQPRPRKP